MGKVVGNWEEGGDREDLDLNEKGIDPTARNDSGKDRELEEEVGTAGMELNQTNWWDRDEEGADDIRNLDLLQVVEEDEGSDRDRDRDSDRRRCKGRNYPWRFLQEEVYVAVAVSF
ncbi:hypothetical protein AAC387_Pa05g2624 [Persea americana]